MSAAVGVVDDIREAVDGLRVRVGPLQGDLDMHLSLVAHLCSEYVQNLLVNDLLLLVHRLNVLPQATVVLVLDLYRIPSAEVTQPYLQAGIEECRSPQSGIDMLEVVFRHIAEDGHVGLEVDFCPCAVGFTSSLQCSLPIAPRIFLIPHFAIPVDGH